MLFRSAKEPARLVQLFDGALAASTASEEPARILAALTSVASAILNLDAALVR